MKTIKKNYAKLKRRIMRLINRVITNVNKPEMKILPGQLAFFFFMALIPLIAIIGSLISLLDLPYSSMSDLLNNYFPNGTVNLLMAISVKINLSLNFIVFFASALFLASNGTYSMITVSNQIYKIKNRNYLRGRAKAFMMMLVLFVLLLFLILIPVFGDTIFKLINLSEANEFLRRSVYAFYRALKYPLSVVFIFILVKVLYIMAPDKKIDRHNVNYGAVFTSFSWVFLTQIYSWYVENFNNYTTLYGSISSVLILMLWIYLLCYIFVLGMALNVTKYEFNEEKTNDSQK